MDYKAIYTQIEPSIWGCVPEIFPTLNFTPKGANEYKSNYHFDGGEHSSGRKGNTTAKRTSSGIVFADWSGGCEKYDTIGLYEKLYNCSFVDAVKGLAMAVGCGYLIGEQQTPTKPRTTNKATICPPAAITQSETFDTIAPEMVEATTKRPKEQNTLFQYLSGLLGAECVVSAFNRYRVGTSKTGGCIYWQIDQNSQARTAKIIEYLSNGHRNKKTFANWVHSALIKSGRLKDYTLKQCLFGLHLLYADDDNIILVEAEKTAIILSLFVPNVVLSVGGMQNISVSMLAPLRGKNILVYSDVDAVAVWKEKLSNVSQKVGFGFGFVEWWKDKQIEDKADIADYLLSTITAPTPQKPFLEPTKDEQQKNDKLYISVADCVLRAKKRGLSVVWVRIWQGMAKGIARIEEETANVWLSVEDYLNGCEPEQHNIADIESMESEPIDRYIGEKSELLLCPF